MRDVQGKVGASQGTPVSRIFHSEAFDTVACVASGFLCVFSFAVLKFKEIQPHER